MVEIVDDYNATGTFVRGKLVPYSDKNKPPKEAMQPASMAEDNPFASLPAATQKALETAGITTVEGAKALQKDGLVALEGIGDKGAEAVLAL